MRLSARTLKAFAVAACLAGIWAGLVWITGGFRTELFGLRISSSAIVRPLIASVLLGLLPFVGNRARFREVWAWTYSHIERAALVVAILTPIVICLIGIRAGSKSAGGSDSYGYVSQAFLWLNGGVVRPYEPFQLQAPWREPEWTFTPLGYRPGVTNGTYVPVYASGLPLIMAAFWRVCGPCGPFFVTPVFAALLIAMVHLLALRLTGRQVVGAIAGVWVATAPAFLFNLMWPMSDIVNAALWTLALWAAFSGSSPAIAISGLAAGSAILVRPNMAPLALVILLCAVLSRCTTAGAATLKRAAITTVTFSAGVLPFCLAVAVLNARLHGSAIASGYGQLNEIYSLATAGTNLRRYTGWLWRSEGWTVLLATVPLLHPRLRIGRLKHRQTVVLSLLYAGMATSLYLFYTSFDNWWYLRFLLPVFPVLAVFLAAGAVALADAVPKPVGVAVLLVALFTPLAHTVPFSRTEGVLRLGDGERRYADAGTYLATALPRNAIVLAMQHSGSVRFYSGLPILRYDLISSANFDAVLRYVREAGKEPFILLEDWEEDIFRTNFASNGPIGRLEGRVLASTDTPTRVRLFSTGELAPPTSVTPPLMRSADECHPPNATTGPY